MGDFILYKNLEGKYLTLQDCLDENKEKHENTIFYVTNEKEQSQYINMFKEEGIDAVIMPAAIDSPFISHVEQKKEGLKFLRIDTDLNAAFKEEVKEDDEEFKKTSEELTEYFKKALNNDKLDIKVEKMKNAGVASMITISEDTSTSCCRSITRFVRNIRSIIIPVWYEVFRQVLHPKSMK